MPSANTRTEHDLLGDFQVPADAYYGVQTARAVETFKITDKTLSVFPTFIRPLAMVKIEAWGVRTSRRGFEGGSHRDQKACWRSRRRSTTSSS
jgi:aspartate ammonia-lyase